MRHLGIADSQVWRTVLHHKEKGTVLGLMVLHEGMIGVTSVVDMGTVVEILLPAAMTERV
ncbi:hypothetical protein [Tumebacillus avium]|nr:hypothetical protein [Tumebacillus avium]